MSAEFAGRILIRDHQPVTASPFAETAWDTDTPSLPATTVHAWTETAWDGDTAARTPVIGLIIVEDTW